MISYLFGKVLKINKNVVTVLTESGLGYDVYLTGLHAAEQKQGEIVEFPTHLKVSETAMELFGFRNAEEKSFFQMLLSVKGIGPKGAMNVLALGSIEEIQAAIGSGDVKYLTAVQGMGKKTAERLVVELKSKVVAVVKEDALDESGSIGEVVEALTSMGYSLDDVREVVKSLDRSLPVEKLLREALKGLA